MTRTRHCLVVTDIFGITDAIMKLSHELTQLGCAVSLIDPYQGKDVQLADEEDLYDYFLRACGHEEYLAKVSHALVAALTRAKQDIFIIGFSAGANAAWRALNKLNPLVKAHQANGRIKHFVGFYPTQIRHHLTLSPVCRSTLIFAEHEKHINVKDVMGHLSKINHTQCIKVPLHHGFMNPSSINYDQPAHVTFENMFLQYIKENPSDSHWGFLEEIQLLKRYYKPDTSA